MADFLTFCAWLARWLVRKPVMLFCRTLREELKHYLTRRQVRGR